MAMIDPISLGLIVEINIGFPLPKEDARTQAEGLRELASIPGIRMTTCENPDCTGCCIYAGMANSPHWKTWEERQGELKQELESER